VTPQIAYHTPKGYTDTMVRYKQIVQPQSSPEEIVQLARGSGNIWQADKTQFHGRQECPASLATLVPSQISLYH